MHQACPAVLCSPCNALTKCTAQYERQEGTAGHIDKRLDWRARDLCVGAVQSLEWSDRALFGLVSGQHKWHLQPQTKKFLGILGKNRTQVTLDQEITGGSVLLQAPSPCGYPPDAPAHAISCSVRPSLLGDGMLLHASLWPSSVR